MQQEQHAILLAIYSITKQEELVKIVAHDEEQCMIVYTNGHTEVQPIRALIY